PSRHALPLNQPSPFPYTRTSNRKARGHTARRDSSALSAIYAVKTQLRLLLRRAHVAEYPAMRGLGR
ncbi:MAG: hypothetical protein WA077_13085, partial [Anaerolineae bacterium]